MSSGCLTLDIAGAKGAGSCTGIIDGLGYIGGLLQHSAPAIFLTFLAGRRYLWFSLVLRRSLR